MRRLTAALLTAFILSGALSVAAADGQAVTPDPATRASNTLAVARQRYRANTNDTEAAWQFGRACFDAWEFARAKSDREHLALDGIEVCRALTRRQPKSAPAHFYLALNLGQLARTRGFGALKLLDDMESALKIAIEADASLDHAGPDRTLGLLYRDAPGWPISLGSHKKARIHLEQCVRLAPGYPENHLALIELLLDMADNKSALAAAPAAEAVLSTAAEKFPGDEWAPSRADWSQRWQQVRKKLDALSKKPRLVQRAP